MFAISADTLKAIAAEQAANPPVAKTEFPGKQPWEMDHEHYERTTVGGYIYDGDNKVAVTIAELRRAFDKVSSGDGWKAPIVAVVPIGDIKITYEAIRFYHGVEAEFGSTHTPSSEKYPTGIVMKSRGYAG